MASLGVGLRLAFWAYTGRVWEDALITIAHARNAVAGLGLTHHAGEPPTHGFTSALSVLIPLVGEAISRDGGLFVIASRADSSLQQRAHRMPRTRLAAIASPLPEPPRTMPRSQRPLATASAAGRMKSG